MTPRLQVRGPASFVDWITDGTATPAFLLRELRDTNSLRHHRDPPRVDRPDAVACSGGARTCPAGVRAASPAFAPQAADSPAASSYAESSRSWPKAGPVAPLCRANIRRDAAERQ